MDTDGGLRGTSPKDVARELLRGSYRAASILAGAVIVQITALAWLMITLAQDTGIDVTTIPAVSRCIGFAVLATAVAMTAARLLLGRHLSALMTVAVLAGWSLLPGTLVLFPVSPYGGPILMLLSVTPLFLALLAFAAIAAGSRVTGTTVLITSMMLVAAICYAARRAGQPRLVRDRGLVHRPAGSSAHRNGLALQAARANVNPSRAGCGKAPCPGRPLRRDNTVITTNYSYRNGPIRASDRR